MHKTPQSEPLMLASACGIDHSLKYIMLDLTTHLSVPVSGLASAITPSSPTPLLHAKDRRDNTVFSARIVATTEETIRRQ